MSPGDVLRLGLLGVTARRFWAALSALGIALGIATMIVVTGIPSASQRALLDELTTLGTNMLRAEPAPGQDPPATLSADAIARVLRIGPVTGAAAVANTHQVVRRSDRVAATEGVLERRRQIGLRRALGATRGHIRAQFLTEVVVLSVLGGAAGTAIGVVVTFGYSMYQRWPLVLPGLAVTGGLAGTIVVGAAAGLYPSIRAARLTPTEALAAA